MSLPTDDPPTRLDGEATIMIVWPSNAAYALGRFLGRLYDLKAGWYIFRLGNLCALLSIPLALPLYLCRVAPWIGRRYRLTNRRIVVERGLTAREQQSLGLDEFDTVDVEVLPGQVWYDAGDLVFRRDGREMFRLPGVGRPLPFLGTCRDARAARIGVLATAAQK